MCVHHQGRELRIVVYGYFNHVLPKPPSVEKQQRTVPSKSPYRTDRPFARLEASESWVPRLFSVSFPRAREIAQREQQLASNGEDDGGEQPNDEDADCREQCDDCLRSTHSG